MERLAFYYIKKQWEHSTMPIRVAGWLDLVRRSAAWKHARTYPNYIAMNIVIKFEFAHILDEGDLLTFSLLVATTILYYSS